MGARRHREGRVAAAVPQLVAGERARALRRAGARAASALARRRRATEAAARRHGVGSDTHTHTYFFNFNIFDFFSFPIKCGKNTILRKIY